MFIASNILIGIGIVLLIASVVLFFKLGVKDAFMFIRNKRSGRGNIRAMHGSTRRHARPKAAGTNQNRQAAAGVQPGAVKISQDSSRNVVRSADRPTAGSGSDKPTSNQGGSIGPHKVFDPEGATDMLEEDSENPTGILQEGSESPTGILQEGSESPTGILQEGSESPTGILQEASETPTGILQEGSESPTGILQEDSAVAKPVAPAGGSKPSEGTKGRKKKLKVIDKSKLSDEIGQSTSGVNGKDSAPKEMGSENPTSILSGANEDSTGILTGANEDATGVLDGSNENDTSLLGKLERKVRKSSALGSQSTPDKSSFRFDIVKDEIVFHTDEKI